MSLVAVLTLSLAVAPSPKARLEFASASAACTEAKLREAVAARLGYDPFVAEAALAVRVQISAGAPLRAQLTISRPGAPEAGRALSGPPDCVSLTNGVALALALTVDPLVLTRPPAPPPEPEPPEAPAVDPAPAAPPAPAPQAALPAPAPPAPVASRPLQVALLAGAAVELGQQPALTPGFRAGVRFGGATLTGLVEAALTLPSRQAVTGGAIDTFFVGGDLGVCAGAWRVAGCALVRAGGLQFRGEGFADSRSGWLPSVSAGARATFEWPADTLFALQASAELRVPIVRLKLSVGDERVWEQGWVTGNAAAALVVRIP